VTDDPKEKQAKLVSYKEVFSKNLREVVLSQLEWSHTRFGKEIGVSQVQASKYLNGVSSPPFEKMDLIELRTGVRLLEFFRTDRTPKLRSDHQEFAEQVSVLNESSSKNAVLLQDLIKKVGPLLAEAGVEGSPEIHLTVGTKNDRLEDFLGDVVQNHQLSEAFLELLADGADPNTLQVEFLREYCQALVAGGGQLAIRAKKVLSDILTSEKAMKK
jgi:transcriptional regulator with XRE-family HTH domain